MQALLGTLFDITLLRRGPDALPHSRVVLAMCVALWFFALAATAAMISNFSAYDAAVAVGSAVLGLLCYSIVLVGTGFRARVLQTFSALIGCGALISIAMLALLVLMTPFVGRNLAYLAAFLLLAWSVPVKGHIIARAIDRHWYAGIVIALGIFILQLVFTRALTPEA